MGLCAQHGLEESEQNSDVSVSSFHFVCSLDSSCFILIHCRYKTAAENIPSEVVQTVTIEAEDQDTGDLVQIKFEGNLYVGPAKVLFTPYLREIYTYSL